MARKSATALRENDELVKEAVEEFEAVTEMKFDIAQASYDKQDADTQKMVDELVRVLTQHATGKITVEVEGVGPMQVKVDDKFIGWNALYIVMDMLKTLALFDIRVGKFVFDSSHCVSCEAELGG
jgi:hypothetical protein